MTVSIRDASTDDAQLIAEWVNAPRVCKFLGSNFRRGTMEPGLIRAALRRPDQHWFVFEVDQSPAGIVVLDQIDKGDGIANCWYAMGDEGFLGKGHTSEAIKLATGQNALELHVLTAWAGEANQASRRCLEKAGFNEAGKVTSSAVIDGSRMDRILYEKVLIPC